MFISNPHPKLAELAPNGQAKVDFLAWFNGGLVIDNRNLFATAPGHDRGAQLRIKLLPEAMSQNLMKPRGSITHSQAGSRKATNDQLWTYLSNADVAIEPHVIGPEFGTGNIIQAVPFNRVAHCNYKANDFFIGGVRHGFLSMETQDNGIIADPGLRVTQWDLAQFGMIASMLTAWGATYGIRCWMPQEWNDNGHGYHSLHAEWSAYVGKTCPGQARIGQFPELLNHVATRLAYYYEAVGESCP